MNRFVAFVELVASCIHFYYKYFEEANVLILVGIFFLIFDICEKLDRSMKNEQK